MRSLDSMTPETHRRIDFSLERIGEEVSRCRDLSAAFLTNLEYFGLSEYSRVMTARDLVTPIKNPLFRVRVHQMLSSLNRVAVGWERHAIDFETLNLSEGGYIASTTWRWHVFIEARRRYYPGYEDSYAPLQLLVKAIAEERLRLPSRRMTERSTAFWKQLLQWGDGEWSDFLGDIEDVMGDLTP